MNPLHWLLDGSYSIHGYPLVVREVFGNAFGLASAVLGMRRNTWAWPIGIVGNALLFTVYVAGVVDFDRPQAHNLWGQAGRQVFFALVSVYGWYRWHQARRRKTVSDGGAVAPRWARATELRAMVLAGAVMMFAFYYPLQLLGSFDALADDWILTGSILATYGMARGYVEFWCIWIGVDAVGVPLLFKTQYYPSAAMYFVYGGFCVWGFAQWIGVQRRLRVAAPVGSSAAGEPEGVLSGA